METESNMFIIGVVSLSLYRKSVGNSVELVIYGSENKNEYEIMYWFENKQFGIFHLMVRYCRNIFTHLSFLFKFLYDRIVSFFVSIWMKLVDLFYYIKLMQNWRRRLYVISNTFLPNFLSFLEDIFTYFAVHFYLVRRRFQKLCKTTVLSKGKVNPGKEVSRFNS